MGYSLDNSTDTTVVTGELLTAQVASGTGTHTLHVQGVGQRGAVCVTDVAVNVAANTSLIPSWATIVSSIQSLGNWDFHSRRRYWVDGQAAQMAMVSSPSVSGSSREF